MGGENPYLKPGDVTRPAKPYRVTFLPLNVTVTVDPAAGERVGHHGLPLSVLDIAEANDIQLDHSCGGVCACSTCHVIVREGFDTCNPATDDELDQLDNARGLEAESRLGCQCVPDGTADVVVEIPAWNRNLVRE